MLNEPIIETNSLSKKFRIGTKERLTLFTTLRYKLSGEYPTKDYWALKDINVSINRGELVPIIGPNGAGKTTLLRILSGIMAPTSGSFSVKGDVSCIFELGLGFNPRFTAIENVYLYGALHGMTRREIDKKLPEIVEFAGLEEFMETKLGDYSSGMKARLAFATVIQTVSEIVMIDEVLSVGDAAFQVKCVDAIEKLLNRGNTVLFISHGIGDIKKYCKRALYIDKGKQVGFGDIDEVVELYAKDTAAIANSQET
jgi:lipopolysaccharide transport system ATP-binding protein